MAQDWAAKRRKAGLKFARQAGRTAFNPSVGNMALLAYRGVKGLRAIVNSEEFVLDTGVGASVAAYTASVIQINAMGQGDGQSSRTGNSILMKKVHRTEQITVTSGNATIREILFYDKQQIADTAPSATDLLDASTPWALYNKLSKSRFQVLEDKLTVLTSVNRPVILRRNTKQLNKHATFNGTTSADIQKMGLYRLIITDNAVTVVGSYRLFYHDN